MELIIGIVVGIIIGLVVGEGTFQSAIFGSTVLTRRANHFCFSNWAQMCELFLA